MCIHCFYPATNMEAFGFAFWFLPPFLPLLAPCWCYWLSERNEDRGQLEFSHCYCHDSSDYVVCLHQPRRPHLHLRSCLHALDQECPLRRERQNHPLFDQSTLRSEPRTAEKDPHDLAEKSKKERGSARS